MEQRKILQGERADLRLAALQFLLFTVGTSSGVISVSSTDCSTSSTSDSNCPDEMTQRIRCWISVLGTPALTL